MKLNASRRRCLSCGGRLGWWMRLLNRRFCCIEHERAYLEDLRILAIERLQALVPSNGE